MFAALERGRAQSRRLVPVTPPEGASAPHSWCCASSRRPCTRSGPTRRRTDEARGLRERIAQVQDELRGLAWQADGLGSAQGRAALPQVRERLAARDRELVVLGRHGDALVAVVVGRGRPRLVHLAGRARADALTRTVRADLDVVARAASRNGCGPRRPPPPRTSSRRSTRCCSARSGWATDRW